MSLCNICEAPATVHSGAGPRCALHVHSEAATLHQLRVERARLDRMIADRYVDKMRALDAAKARDSVPPVLATNTPTRAQSDQHFRNARQILKGIK